MNYAQIRKYDTANGRGIRTSVFFSGCTHNCYNCFNKEYQNFQFGEKFREEQIEKIISYLKEDYISGLTLLGGEPLQQDKDMMVHFLQKVREKMDINKDIWIYSGYTFEEILACPYKKDMLSYADVLVDGRFMERYKDLTLKFRGSSNQRILDVKKSLEKEEAVFIEEFI